jgi:very-short-patch-repair endonuclease
VTFAEKVQAAVLYGGVGAAVSGDALLHLTKPRRGAEPVAIDVAVAADSQVARRDFFRPHRCSRLPELTHPAWLPQQIRVAPAALHAASWAASDRTAEWKVAAAVQQRLVTVPQLRAALELLPRLRRRRSIRLVLDDVEFGAHARTELDFLAFLRRNRLPLPDRLQFKVRANGVRYLDAWWEKQRLGVEVDGTHHMEVGSWDEDTLRANDLLVAERHDRVMLLRVTAGNMRHKEPELIAQFRAVLL